jgi:hypothetical protein
LRNEITRDSQTPTPLNNASGVPAKKDDGEAYMRLNLFDWNSNRKLRTFAITLLVTTCGLVPRVFGQDNWKGGAGNWNDSTKWTAGVPTSTSNVFIDHGLAGASSVTVSDGEQSGNLTIDSDDSVTVLSNAILKVFGSTISNAGALSIAATSSGANFDINGSCDPDRGWRFEHVKQRQQRHLWLWSKQWSHADQSKHDPGIRND